MTRREPGQRRAADSRGERPRLRHSTLTARTSAAPAPDARVGRQGVDHDARGALEDRASSSNRLRSPAGTSAVGSARAMPTLGAGMATSSATRRRLRGGEGYLDEVRRERETRLAMSASIRAAQHRVAAQLGLTHGADAQRLDRQVEGVEQREDARAARPVRQVADRRNIGRLGGSRRPVHAARSVPTSDEASTRQRAGFGDLRREIDAQATIYATAERAPVFHQQVAGSSIGDGRSSGNSDGGRGAAPTVTAPKATP